jgi:hypothetical protein
MTSTTSLTTRATTTSRHARWSPVPATVPGVAVPAGVVPTGGGSAPHVRQHVHDVQRSTRNIHHGYGDAILRYLSRAGRQAGSRRGGAARGCTVVGPGVAFVATVTVQ